MNTKFSISLDEFNRIQKMWSNNGYKVAKIVTHSEGYKTVGDKRNRPGHGHRHKVYWDKLWNTSVPLSVIHTYENILQTQHWREVSETEKKEFGLYEYPLEPRVDMRRPGFLITGIPYPERADRYLQYLNGYLNTLKGRMKKVRIWFLVYYNRPQTVVEYQRDLWKGGNKNELIIMVGTNKSHEVQWADVLTWCEKDILKLNIKDELLLDFAGGKDGYSGKLTDEDLLKFVKWLEPEVQKNFAKPSFKEDYDYLSFEPSGTATAIVYVIVVFINLATGIFVVYNPWED